MDAPVIFSMFALLTLVWLAYMHGYQRGYSDAEEKHGIKE